MNLRQQFEQRAAIKQSVHAFFADRGYLEVETPILVPQPGVEVHVSYFETQWRDLKGQPQPLSMRSSPELSMKKLLGEDLPRIYQLGPCFRNDGELGDWHHPEFSLLEWYNCHLSMAELIEETAQLIQHTCRYLPVPTKEPSWSKITVAEAFHRFAGITLEDQDKALGQKGAQAGLHSPRPEDDFETAYFKILIEAIEPALRAMDLICLYDFPESQAILARCEHGVAKRFEFYWKGIELCNGFDELTDMSIARQRLLAVNEAREALGKPAIPIDDTFYQTQMPSCCGNALGFDRLIALLAGDSNIDRAKPKRHHSYTQA